MSKIMNFIELAQKYQQLGGLDSLIHSAKRLDTTFSPDAETHIVVAIMELEEAVGFMLRDLQAARTRLEADERRKP